MRKRVHLRGARVAGVVGMVAPAQPRYGGRGVPREAAAQAGLRSRACYDPSPGTLDIGNLPVLSGHRATRNALPARDGTATG